MGKKKSVLEGLIGAAAEEVTDSVKKAAQILDQAGIVRKQTEGEAALEKVDDAVLSALESAGATDTAALVKNILSALEEAGALAAIEEKLGSHEAAVSLLLKAVAGKSPAETPETSEASPAGQEMEMMKSLKDYIASTTKDMGEIARGQVDMAQAVKSLIPKLEEQEQRLRVLEQRLDERPRQASQAQETRIENQTIESKIKKGLEGDTRVLGIPVKEMPADGKGK